MVTYLYRKRKHFLFYRFILSNSFFKSFSYHFVVWLTWLLQERKFFLKFGLNLVFCSTLPLIYARPSTVDRYGSTAKIYPMDDWTERINNCLDDIGRTARSMNRWTQIKPENRYNFSLVS